MDFGLALMKMHPNVSPSQYELMAQPDGSVVITRWDPADVPKPTADDVTNFWNTGMMDYHRTQKNTELDAKCDEAIMGGFTSSALGVTHTYPSDFQAMVFYNATLNRFANDPTFTTANQKTLDSGYLSHTKAQFIQAFNDGHAYGEEQIAHLNSLKSQVNSAQTQEELAAITW